MRCALQYCSSCLPLGEGVPDQEAVPRYGAHTTATVQTVPEADCVDCPKGQAQGALEAVQGGADEEDSHVGYAV